MREKAVLIITPFASPNIGGAETHVDKLRAYLNGKKWRVVLATYQPLTTPITAPYQEEGDGYNTYRMPWFGRKSAWFHILEKLPFPLVFTYLFPGLLAVSLYAAWRHRNSISVIHAHGLTAIAVGRIVKGLFGFRLVASTHAIYGLIERPVLTFLLRWLFRKVDFVLAVGEPSRGEFMKYVGILPEKIDLHSNWVDLDFFKPLSRYDRYHFKVLFVGRLIEKKGIRQLLEAASRLPNVSFSIIGSGPEKETILRSGLANVFYRGRVSTSVLPAYYSAADATILPSQYDEGFSSVVCESIACGTPVLVPMRGVLADILDKNVAVFMDPSPKGIVAAIQEISTKLNNEPLFCLYPMEYSCRKFAEEHFGPKNADIIERALRG